MRRAIASRARLQHIPCCQQIRVSGDEQTLNFVFATNHNSSHLLAGYDTPPRGELLVSSFTAAMHRKDAMSRYALPVIFSWRFGIALNEFAGAAKGARDPQEFDGRVVRPKMGLAL